jgi:hypothetical protein
MMSLVLSLLEAYERAAFIPASLKRGNGDIIAASLISYSRDFIALSFLLGKQLVCMYEL